MSKFEKFRRLSRHVVLTLVVLLPATVAGYLWEAIVSAFKVGRQYCREDEKLAIETFLKDEPDANPSHSQGT